MKRRTFLFFSILIFATRGFASGKKVNEFDIIKDVYNHLFPINKRYAGASLFGAFDFFITASKHPTFDQDDFRIIINGAKKLLDYEKDFLQLSKEKKEKVLREFETTNLGQNFLSLLLYYGFEAMLGDPIYNGNKKMSGWKNISHTPPTPLAKKRYGKNNGRF